MARSSGERRSRPRTSESGAWAGGAAGVWAAAGPVADSRVAANTVATTKRRILLHLLGSGAGRGLLARRRRREIGRLVLRCPPRFQRLEALEEAHALGHLPVARVVRVVEHVQVAQELGVDGLGLAGGACRRGRVGRRGGTDQAQQSR